MQVEAIYIQGRIEFVQALFLKHDHVSLVVTVPEKEVQNDVIPVTDTMEAKVRAILRPHQHLLDSSAPVGLMDYDSIRDEYLADKYLSSR